MSDSAEDNTIKLASSPPYAEILDQAKERLKSRMRPQTRDQWVIIDLEFAALIADAQRQSAALRRQGAGHEQEEKDSGASLGSQEAGSSAETVAHPTDDRLYPCAECGVLRSKAEGGTTFTVCDDCWDQFHPRPIPDMAGTEPRLNFCKACGTALGEE